MINVLLIKNHIKTLLFPCLILLIWSHLSFAKAPIDKSRYITIDEVQPGQQAYCLTVIEGNKIEKFNFKVLSIVPNYQPGLDGILVIGTDQRFKKTGAIKGCSGSPVYIDGRLAGALGHGWSYSDDPLYYVTPIEYMLQIGTAPKQSKNSQSHSPASVAFDFSGPINLKTKNLPEPQSHSQTFKTSVPLVTSFSQSACTELTDLLQPLGLLPIAAGSAGNKQNNLESEYNFKRGSVMAIPLLTGDLSMAATGTATEVIGDKVYGFGHNFMGHGPVDLPMSTGYVHTVVSNMVFSFKLSTPTQICGAIRFDESTGIYGKIGAEPKMIPLNMTVDRYNDPQKRTYNCKLAYDRFWTPQILQTALLGAGLMRGSLPPEHMLEYKAAIGIGDHPDMPSSRTISFENISSEQSFSEFVSEAAGPVALLMNNPYSKVDITSLNFEVKILPKNNLSTIWSMKLSDSTVRPGRTIDVSVVLQSYMAEKTTSVMKLKIPDDIEPGTYKITVAGAYEYEKFLRKNRPQNFMAHNLTTLIDAIDNIVSVHRDKLYLILSLPPGGIVIQQTELPDLPPTKALLLQNPKRTIKTQPYQHWIQKVISIDTIVLNRKNMTITIEK